MRKAVLFILFSIILTSCGGDKKKESVDELSTESVNSKDNYSIIFEGIYEKNDEISMVFKKGGNWDYDHPTTFKIVGQPTMQKLIFDLPYELSIDNVQIDLSSNHEQKTLTLKGVYVLNNGKEVINGSNMAFIKYFNTGGGLDWDFKKLRYNLIFGGQYPPRMCGNDVLESILTTK
jgi:hypothetical protein